MINVALVGYGYWGPNIAKNIHANPGLNLHTICDIIKNSLNKAKSIYMNQTNYENTYQKLLDNDDIHAIAIAVETSSHYSLAKQALLAGKNVFVEKPFTSTVKEAIELDELAKNLNLIIHIDHIMIFHPVIKKIKNLIDNNELGDILFIDAMRMDLGQIKKDVSAMWDLAVHDLAIIDYLMDGKEPFYINSIGEKYYNPKESLSFLTMRYEGFISHVRSSWISPLKERKLIVVGSRKMVVFDDLKSEKLSIYDKGVDVLNGNDINYKDYAVKTRDGDILIPYIQQEDALYNSIHHFKECIEENKQSISSPNQAIRLQRILEIADVKMNK